MTPNEKETLISLLTHREALLMRFPHTASSGNRAYRPAQAEAELHGDASPGPLEAARFFSESKGNLTVGAFYALDAFFALMAENNRHIFRILGVGT